MNIKFCIFFALMASLVKAKEYSLNKYDMTTSSLYFLCSGSYNNGYFLGGTIEINYDISCQYSSQFATSLCRAKPLNVTVYDIQYSLNGQTFNMTYISNTTKSSVDYPLSYDVGNYQYLIPLVTEKNETAGVLNQCSYDNSKQKLDCTNSFSYVLCKN